MYTHAREVMAFTSGKSYAEFESDLLLRRGVERSIEIVGEASRKLSKELKADHPEIAWQGIEGQRHVLAHEYGHVLSARIWRVAIERIPELVDQLDALFKSHGEDTPPTLP